MATPIMVVHQVPSLTQERYEEVVRKLTNGKRRLESPADLPFDGLLVHVAAQTENGSSSSMYSSPWRHSTASGK
jgi:hypothetical protein